jgi:hypothetical protein
MSLLYYFAAWTDSGCFLGCDHEHPTIISAVSCIPCAGGYVVAVENGELRALNSVEERQFQALVHGAPEPLKPLPPLNGKWTFEM